LPIEAFPPGDIHHFAAEFAAYALGNIRGHEVEEGGGHITYSADTVRTDR
jgi:hypothetical protein